jgi:nucleoside-diphosphate-sugar epimerase
MLALSPSPLPIQLRVSDAHITLYTYLVTGAAGGMGLTVVKAILQSGADVIAVDRHEAASPAHKGTHCTTKQPPRVPEWTGGDRLHISVPISERHRRRR